MGEVILRVFEMPVVQAALIAVLLVLIKMLAERYHWAKTVTQLALSAYVFAEKEGLLQGLAGYQKFGPFMARFVEEYEKQFGKAPGEKDKARAVQEMEKLVQNEFKASVQPVQAVGE